MFKSEKSADTASSTATSAPPARPVPGGESVIGADLTIMAT